MRYDICILSDDASFSRMLMLELTDRGRRVTLTDSEGALPEAEIYLIDADRYPDAAPNGRVLRYGFSVAEDGEGALRRPFTLTALAEATAGGAVRRGLFLLPKECAVRLDGAHIRLTRLEYALLARLAAADGAPVAKEALRREVFGEESDEGVVNVYIHYLRRKLEGGGRRLIYALRGQGYALRREEDGR